MPCISPVITLSSWYLGQNSLASVKLHNDYPTLETGVSSS
jgi:hypothetical protein